MIGVEAAKIKVYHLDYHDDDIIVFLKEVKDGQAVITKIWAKVVCAFGMEKGTIWAFASSPSPIPQMHFVALLLFCD